MSNNYVNEAVEASGHIHGQAFTSILVDHNQQPDPSEGQHLLPCFCAPERAPKTAKSLQPTYNPKPQYRPMLKKAIS